MAAHPSPETAGRSHPRSTSSPLPPRRLRRSGPQPPSPTAHEPCSQTASDSTSARSPAHPSPAQSRCCDRPEPARSPAPDRPDSATHSPQPAGLNRALPSASSARYSEASPAASVPARQSSAQTPPACPPGRRARMASYPPHPVQPARPAPGRAEISSTLPRRGAQNEYFSGLRLEHHLFVEFTHPHRLPQRRPRQKNPIQPAIRDRPTIQNRNGLHALPRSNPIPHPIPRNPRPKLRKLIARIPPRQHIQHPIKHCRTQPRKPSSPPHNT